MKRIVKTVEETQALAGHLAQQITAGTIILLKGDLGAGKTTFTQGFARALGIQRPLKSPTFTLVREYETVNFPLYHFDVYRLGEEGGADELGLDEYFRPDSVVLIEWAEFIQDLLPSAVIQVELKRLDDDLSGDLRMIEISSFDPTLADMIKNMED
ncbi:tRNA (adenosine(37)-N6)-threonylcarbamoyltransferase complex ATPase subunit type 1 TsaE [Weissella coleopterorum]|uniref:tRNA threonylcarbamoyladenosine biosynthesis protein TsaE n=1 Tax=Weissella coleopterorum TaxID=2714949 RepID=A0A6G8B1Z3_9LACO|nr:tRNA (adenosine(37)-N6)-threonylcarbamoyltransferase complex ATPase subunit type 1 TsaE [Weissella coleopterorum]QIL51260.1 tRNA (adenosine(37)-N6)-threonylcarbamoyltransferase complex ATPase subunit type 1 TsaE [Weissella coleopterorum]